MELEERVIKENRANKWQVDHLFLLVGRNPLPNAISGSLLTTPNGVVTLIHTESTASIASHLRDWFVKNGLKAKLCARPVASADSTSIINGVLEELGKGPSDSSLGLNYTGGTKAMSVHAFRALEAWGREKRVRIVFSYLDAQTMQLRFDPDDLRGGGSQAAMFVGQALEPELVDLLFLHGWEFKSQPHKKPLLPESSRALASAFSNRRSSWQWIDWKKAFLKKGRLKDGKQSSMSNLLRGKLASEPSLNAAFDIVCSELGQPGTDGLNVKQAVNEGRIESIGEFCAWVDGKWLENYVLRILAEELATELGLHSCVKNIVTKGVTFELDVAAMRGYQLFAFSCGTDSDNLNLQASKNQDPIGYQAALKRKLFEVFVRASQLGGDEARVALVCCSETPKNLENQMRRDFDFEGRIKVFGRQHLWTLKTEIQNWVIQQGGVAT